MRHLTTLWILALLAACAPEDGFFVETDESIDGEEYYPADDDLAGRADGWSPPRGPLAFTAACEEGEQITIAAVGDVLLHGRLQQQAFREHDRYISLWRGVREMLQRADVTYANFEGPAAAGVSSSGRATADPGETFDNRVYTSYPQFNYHPSVIDDLMASGVDVVSTANNHSLDRRALGADRTLDALDERGMLHTGTRRRGTTEPWYTISDRRGFRLAWLACTFSTNGIPDSEDQVLRCFRDEEEVVDLVTALAGRADVDAVIVTPHWGDEYHASPNREQVRLAHRLLDAGAIAILGAHPHVLQPWERYVTRDGRETFVIYSLGNFVSGQSHLPRRSTLLLYLGLTRTRDGRVVVNGVRYVPLHMSPVSPGLTLEAIDRVGGLRDSRALTVGMFYEWNLLPPNAELVTNPQCDPGWEAPAIPHAHDGWVGGSCEDAGACSGLDCFEEMPDGLCTEGCDRLCYNDRPGLATFCVDLGVEGRGSCVARCSDDWECREGYKCERVGRHNEEEEVRSVCVPRRCGEDGTDDCPDGYACTRLASSDHPNALRLACLPEE